MSGEKTGGLEEIAFQKQELIPAIIQDAASGEVLMLAYMNRQSLEKTLQTGLTWFWSRSRQQFWQKGETSGHIQRVQEIRYDCDADTLLIQVEQRGPACHTGARSCFFNTLGPVKTADARFSPGEQSGIGMETVDELLPWLTKIIRERLVNKPPGSYVSSLLQDGSDRLLVKLAEEAAEVMIASKSGSREEVVHEAADLLFHLLVLLEVSGVSSREVVQELQARRGGKTC